MSRWMNGAKTVMRMLAIGIPDAQGVAERVPASGSQVKRVAITLDGDEERTWIFERGTFVAWVEEISPRVVAESSTPRQREGDL